MAKELVVLLVEALLLTKVSRATAAAEALAMVVSVRRTNHGLDKKAKGVKMVKGTSKSSNSD